MQRNLSKPSFKEMLNHSSISKIARRTKILLIANFILLTCFIVSCVHAPAPNRPKNWISTPIDMRSAADKPNRPLLQIILVYGPWWCHHSALRLVCPDRSVLFWDPGGGYAAPDLSEGRSKDLILNSPPDLEAYLRFTWDYSSVEVEVFEWDLTLDQAHALYDVLLHGTDKSHPAGKFSTTTMGGLCCVALSDFLHRFGKETMNVPKSFFLPHDLARVLYTQSPKRVLAFRRGKQVVYVPPASAKHPTEKPSR